MIELYRSDLKDEFVRLATMFHQESEVTKDTTLNIDKVLNCVDNPNILFCLSKNTDGKYIGFFLGYITDYSWSDDKRAFEEFFYIEPKYRGGLSAVKMIKYFENWALEKGINTIFMTQGTGINVEKTTKFYNNMGYETIGFMTRKEI